MRTLQTLDYGVINIVPKDSIVRQCDTLIDTVDGCYDDFYEIYYTAEKEVVAVEHSELD